VIIRKVYTFIAKPPIEGLAETNRQISNAHRYYNKLIELHRQRIIDLAVAQRRASQSLVEADAMVMAADNVLAALRTSIRERNAIARRKTATKADRLLIATAKERLKEAKDYRKVLRVAVRNHPEYAAAKDAIWTAHYEARRQARAECGCYFGTYLLIERAIEQATGQTKNKNGTQQFRKPVLVETPVGVLDLHLPHFRRWTGGGLAGCQLQNGLAVAKALACTDSRFRVEIPPGVLEKKCNRLVVFWIRVASDHGNPVWAKVPAYLPRRYVNPREPQPDFLAEETIIKWATIDRRQVTVRRNSEGAWVPYYNWQIQLTVTEPTKSPVNKSGNCGIDLGWRLMDDKSLRVAYLVDSTGAKESIELPTSLTERWERSFNLASLRDVMFNTIKAKLGEFIRSHECPDWLTSVASYLGLWRAKGKLAKLVDQWQRFAGDDDIFRQLQYWRGQDVHLWQWEVNNLKRAQRIRLELYRRLAHRIKGYAHVVVEDCDWRELNKLPKAESEESVNKVARRMMRIAAVGMLRELLVRAEAKPHSAVNTTKQCHLCGEINEFDQAVELVHQCSACGTAWDQDYNAAMNLLARAKEMDEVEPAREPETDGSQAHEGNGVVKGGRWARRKAKRSQKVQGAA